MQSYDQIDRDAPFSVAFEKVGGRHLALLSSYSVPGGATQPGVGVCLFG